MELAAAVMDALPLPAVLVGPNERLVHANALATKIIGEKMIGRSYVVALRQPVVLDVVEAVFRIGQPGGSDYVTTLAGRETLWRVSAAPLTTPDNETAVLVTFEDRTAMREAGQIRRDFVANVSHELRTPLTALLGFIETLKGAARDDAAARGKFLETMEREAGRMNRLVADLLSLSKVEGVERMRPTDSIDLGGLMQSVVGAVQPLAEEQACALSFEHDVGPYEVPGDQDQLAQVFTNLVENAIKYGNGRVDISIDARDHSPEVRGPAIAVTVTDNGDGIDSVHIPRLTERFYRVDSHRSREMGGTGLGLAIVKHIVNRHRGRLKLESKVGQGTQVTVLLPTHENSGSG